MIPAGDAPEKFVQPWISASGAIANSDGGLGTFDIDPPQYVSAFKDASGARPLFPIRCCIDLSSKRYSSNKPSLKNNRFISITGRLTCIQPGQFPDVNRFCVDIENFDFLGYAPPPAAASPSPGIIHHRTTQFCADLSLISPQPDSDTIKIQNEIQFHSGECCRCCDKEEEIGPIIII
jgi:hypothetical protein